MPGSDLAPEEIPFTPGRKIGFFTVVEGVEDRYLLLEATDSRLAAYLAILTEPAGPGRRRFRMVTVVKHLHWTGPLYFTVIRPFHYMVVRGMGRAGARRPHAPPADGRFGRVPLLLLSGGRDRILPASSVRASARRYPRAETHVLPDADHLTGLKTDPGTYTVIVLDFLKRALD